jgi:hypothetical protein
MGYTYGVRWNNDLIENEIRKVISALNIDRMPSNEEIILVNKNSKLSNAIRRNGGFYNWASILGLQVKNCETKTGKEFEEIAKDLLIQQGYRVEKMSTKYPYDLLVNEHIRIDVKAARAHIIKNTRWHTVGLNKKYATCDLYLIFALSETDAIEKMFIIPGTDLKLTSLNFGANSKYDKYLNRWDLLEKYDRFYKQLA